MKILLFIGLGSAIGGMGRYLMQLAIGRYVSIAFPFGTFLVNLSGCFAIGLLYGLFNKFSGVSLEWRLFLITGICGGYTTFSSFSFESITLFKQGNYTYFILYATLSVVLGFLATAGGAALSK